eukprot:8002108-Lingulodinium_polyedra.AAC.1
MGVNRDLPWGERAGSDPVDELGLDCRVLESCQIEARSGSSRQGGGPWQWQELTSNSLVVGPRVQQVDGGLAQQTCNPIAQSQRQDDKVNALALAVRAGP